MSDARVFLIDAVRTPWGKMNGSLSRFNSADLAAEVLKKLAARTEINLEKIDHIVFGQSHPSTYPNNMGHYASLLARFPEEIPGYTVHSNCATGMQSLRTAYYMIASGTEDCCIAGGTDSYSHAPFVIRDARKSFPESSRTIIDSVEEAEYATQPVPMTRAERYEKFYGGRSEAAEVYQRSSAERAKAAAADLVALSYTERKKGEIIVDQDELLASADLPVLPVYADGAAAALMASEEAADALGLEKTAELLGFAVAGCDPMEQSVSGAEAAKKLLTRKGVALEDVAAIEIMENSAEEVLATMEALGASADKVNPAGGALAFGRNEGAEGIVMTMRLVDSLEKDQLGLVCISGAGGQGMAMLLRKC